jgi:hypothetical protein
MGYNFYHFGVGEQVLEAKLIWVGGYGKSNTGFKKWGKELPIIKKSLIR